MRRAALAVLALAAVAAFAVPAVAAEWKNVTVIDNMCLQKFKDHPETHTRACLLQCAPSGYGVLTADGKFLKFDAAGNEKAVNALKATSKADHLKANVSGELSGDTIKVASITFN